MIESRELISVTRQLGSMTEAGVDILRAIKVLRAQTKNVELVALYDRLAHELRLGCGLADAMSHAPEGFSEFAVSLVRQGEASGDLANAFYRIAEYLQKEREVDSPLPDVRTTEIVTVQTAAADQCPLWLRRLIFQGLVALGGLFAVLLLVELFVSIGIILPRWHWVSVAFVMTAFLLGAAASLRNTKEPDKRTQIQQTPDAEKSTFTNSDKSTFDPSSEATFE
ncbi:MAG: type II secretion system F family protein [Abditibacteriaceae bacterium]